ncbi:MAG: MerR family transcriptional regulator [Paracoccus sp. (in: a-proteobacteria)]|uniref:MerR family transcriptional regulator n=1 Tax=Paracoccus sp. TaxID=267 RepID=UPI00391A23FD
MQKGDDAFRSIGEVAQLIGVAAHVLRYWETQFPQLKPMKRPDGRRYYRPDDIRLAAGLYEVLRDDGMTIRGARKLIAVDKGATIRARGEQRLAQPVQPERAAPAAREPAPPPAPVAAATVPPARDHHPTGTAQQPDLPLFVMAGTPAPASVLPGDWLGRLMTLRRALGRLRPNDPRWSAACAAAHRLGQRITGHS